MRRVVFVVAVVVILAGCAAPLAGDEPGTPDGDLGVVDGIAYDDDLSISVENGLNQTELDLLAARSMARIEVIRGLEFEETVDIELMTREEYREHRSSGSDENRTQWENQVWEAKFIVGQDRDVTEELDRTFGDAVQGFYSPRDERVVIVTDGENAAVSKHTLVHELVHVLQDQRFGLEAPPDRLDPAMARNGVIEGEAELIPELYFERCGAEWSCLEPPARTGGQSDVDPGIILLLIQPYQQGPEFVQSIKDQGGWEQVDALHDEYPVSTAQIIDPEKYPDVRPVNVSVEDRSTDEWARLDHEPVAETVGEAAIYVMFWHNRVITVDDFYEYSHPSSSGWTGDELVPYTNDEGESGYVWALEWESADDAEQFADTYRELLAEHGALERGQRSYVIPDGPFAGAFDVHHDGTTVRIVKGPTLGALAEIHS